MITCQQYITATGYTRQNNELMNIKKDIHTGWKFCIKYHLHNFFFSFFFQFHFWHENWNIISCFWAQKLNVVVSHFSNHSYSWMTRVRVFLAIIVFYKMQFSLTLTLDLPFEVRRKLTSLLLKFFWRFGYYNCTYQSMIFYRMKRSLFWSND